MKGKERRAELLKLLSASQREIPGSELAQRFGVSRQVIVQDIALLRAEDHEIRSTNLGYLLTEKQTPSRVFKVIHSDEESEQEMNLIVDNGGTIEDVFVYHKVYGTVSAELKIRSRRDVREFLEDIASGKSSLLKNVTGGYHYHTVSAPDTATLDVIQQQLEQAGFLARLQEYEPVDFWQQEEAEE